MITGTCLCGHVKMVSHLGYLQEVLIGKETHSRTHCKTEHLEYWSDYRGSNLPAPTGTQGGIACPCCGTGETFAFGKHPFNIHWLPPKRRLFRKSLPEGVRLYCVACGWEKETR